MGETGAGAGLTPPKMAGSGPEMGSGWLFTGGSEGTAKGSADTVVVMTCSRLVRRALRATGGGAGTARRLAMEASLFG